MNETEEEELLFFETFSHDNSEVSLSFNRRNDRIAWDQLFPSMSYRVHPKKLLSFRAGLTSDFIISPGSYRLTAGQPVQRYEPAIFRLSCAF